MNNIVYFQDIAMATQHVIQQWQRIANQAIVSHGIFTVAVSGGSSPVRLYQALAQEKNLPWSLTEIFLVDERFVPYTNSDSNYGMIKKQLLDKLTRNYAKMHPIPMDKTPQKSALVYANQLKKNLSLLSNSFPVFDLILLGLGADGHTASLFTQQDCEEKEKFAMYTVSPQIPHNRITLTLPVLNHAKNIIFFIRGEKKLKIMESVFKQRNLNYPASHVQLANQQLSVVFSFN